MAPIIVSRFTFTTLVTALLLSILGNIHTSLVLLWSSHSGSDLRNHIQFPVPVPDAAMRTLPSRHYPLLPEDNHNWTTLIPPLSGGFIYHPEEQDFYSVALYHQLHCLNALRKYIARGSELRLDDEVASHATHCIDYLRQAILCHGDITLEPVHNILVAENLDHNLTQHIDQVAQGWNVSHRCKDWSVVRNYLEDNSNSWPSNGPGL